MNERPPHAWPLQNPPAPDPRSVREPVPPIQDPLLVGSVLTGVMLSLVYLVIGGGQRATLLAHFGVLGLPKLHYLPILGFLLVAALLVRSLRRRRFALGRAVAAVLAVVLLVVLGRHLLDNRVSGPGRIVISLPAVAGIGIIVSAACLTLATHLLYRRHAKDAR